MFIYFLLIPLRPLFGRNGNPTERAGELKSRKKTGTKKNKKLFYLEFRKSFLPLHSQPKGKEKSRAADVAEDQKQKD